MNLGAAWIDAFLAREKLPPQYRALIGTVHAPIANRIALVARQRGGQLSVGLCGSQGSGKSTTAAVLKALLDAQGLPAAVLSIDDLYLTHEERLQLGRRIHPLFRTRGVPGTHDVGLGVTTIDRLRRLRGTVAVPAFDKERDDRRPASAWPVVQAPVSVVILEGWCVGAWPQDPALLAAPLNALERDEDPAGTWRNHVNVALAGDYRALFGPLEMQILLQAPSFDVVYAWRLEQEHKLRERVTAAGGDLRRVMGNDAVARFIMHYERITRHILAEMPARADLVVELDAARAPLRLRGA
jgi:D-glycerate 3-kinase